MIENLIFKNKKVEFLDKICGTLTNSSVESLNELKRSNSIASYSNLGLSIKQTSLNSNSLQYYQSYWKILDRRKKSKSQIFNTNQKHQDHWRSNDDIKMVPLKSVTNKETKLLRFLKKY